MPETPIGWILRTDLGYRKRPGTALAVKYLIAAGRQLADAVSVSPDAFCSLAIRGMPTCLQLEYRRELTEAEKRKGWYVRPFADLDTKRMCSGCRAYFLAERLVQTLNEL